MNHRNDLPIFEIESALVSELSHSNRVIVQAPTGSGKSTQIPQMMLDHGLLGEGQVVILQPRRLPTRVLASFVARQRNSKLGDEVGYQIRFEDFSTARTRIKYETEGILLRQLLTNPNLAGVSAIVFDEFHERHLYGDLTLARAVQLQETARPDLRIVVMSATLDTGPLEKYLAPCRTLISEGRMYPVRIEHLPEGFDPDEEPVWTVAAQEFERLVARHPEGDVLVFMPGAYEISRTIQAIGNSPSSRGFVILPLHGELAPGDQDAAVAQYDRRKVVVSTNVAESSLTIDGVRLVIDSGLARIPRFDPYRGINTLLVEKISRASADQRSGRAGRIAPGVCVRLWSEREHLERPMQELPEVKRLDLSEAVLTLKAGGVGNLTDFRWVDPPEARSLERADTLLKDLGALDAHSGEITELGRRMLSFPVHPRYSRMLIAAGEYGCVRTICLIAALTQGRPILQRRQGSEVREDREDLLGGEAESDFFILIRAWRYAHQHRFDVGRCRRLGIHAAAARQVGPLFDFFLDIAKKEKLPVEESAAASEAVQKCVLTGFSDHLARRVDSGTLRCHLVHGRKGVLARESAIQKHPLFVASEIREIEGAGGELNVLLSLATAIKEEWLKELFPSDFSETIDVEYDSVSRRVVAHKQVLFRDLVMGSKAIPCPPNEQAAGILAEKVLSGELVLKGWDHTIEQWILRVNCLAEWCKDLQLPMIGDEDRKAMIQHVCLGATSYKEIKDRPVGPVVASWLNPAQQAMVDKLVPERLNLANGRKAKITYTTHQPFISMRIQDLYDVKETPRIAKGRVPVVVHILGPNHRPVQVTQDLAGFWRDTYPRVKQELQRKYPKHEWR